MVYLFSALLLESFLHRANVRLLALVSYPRARDQQHREYFQRVPRLSRKIEILERLHSQMRPACLFHLLVQTAYALAQKYFVVLVAVKAPEVVVSEFFQCDFVGVGLDDLLEPARPLRIKLSGVYQHVQVHHEQVLPQARSLFNVVQNVGSRMNFLAKFRLLQ